MVYIIGPQYWGATLISCVGFIYFGTVLKEKKKQLLWFIFFLSLTDLPSDNCQLVRLTIFKCFESLLRNLSVGNTKNYRLHYR